MRTNFVNNIQTYCRPFAPLIYDEMIFNFESQNFLTIYFI